MSKRADKYIFQGGRGERAIERAGERAGGQINCPVGGGLRASGFASERADSRASGRTGEQADEAAEFRENLYPPWT